ncbi:hypothetical protein SteCoe_18622 [Stentor coeruleus]|uniref:Protein kinase domain-containing protein n=1 Tax=Stentor coeruleus TaxID=5963 RepID=A0A1R2BW14_9CILI|nr:hypothetical protein SteCoe_18622 [Stentor coeruleus]
MSRHTELYSLIYQTLKKTISSQIPRPKSANLDILLDKLYKNDPNSILSLEEGIINDLGNNLELLNEALTLSRCCYFLSLTESETRSLQEAEMMFDIIQILESRPDFIIENTLSTLESNIIRDIAKSENLQQLTQWYKYLLKIENTFPAYKVSHGIMTVELKVFPLVLDQIERGNCDINDLLRIVYELSKDPRFNLENLKIITVDHGLTRIGELETQEKYWEISKTLGVIRENNIVESMKASYDYYDRKYKALSSEDDENGTIFALKKEVVRDKVREFINVKVNRAIAWKNADENVFVIKRSGTINLKGRHEVSVFQYSIKGEEEVRFDAEEKRAEKIKTKHDNVLGFVGMFRCKLNNVENLFVVTEPIGKKNSLNHIIKNKHDFDAKQLIRETCAGLAYLESSGVSHRKVNPYNIFFIDGVFRLSFGTSFLYIRENTNEEKFLAPEIKDILANPHEKKPLSFVRADIYSFGATIFYAITEKFYENEMNLNDIKDNKVKMILASALDKKPSARLLFKELYEIIRDMD